MKNLNHKHILVTARGLKNHPTSTDEVEDWLGSLVHAVKMKIVGLETSHASSECWDEAVPFLRMDLYSCDDFEAQTVLRSIKEFAPSEIEWMIVGRNDFTGHSATV
jgi:hypothetical protein